MKITIGGNVIEGTPEELAEYFAMTEDLAKADTCDDACCEDIESETKRDISQVKVGDKVRVIDAQSVVALEAKNGDILTVTKAFGDCNPFNVMDVDGDELWVDYDEIHAFEIVDQEFETGEVADEIAEKWAKLGRKVGEYKKGDIVRIVDQYGGDHVEGAIGVVKYDDTTDAHTPPVIAVCSDGTIDDYFAKVELVAPVESLITHN